jgi:hypothetical protein
MRAISVVDALRDRNLLGAALGDASTWQTWFAVLRAAHGLQLNRDERKLFAAVSGDREPPTRKVKELIAIASRRSGKGRVASGMAIHSALLRDHSSVLAPGEVGVVACVSPTRSQAAILLDYCKGFLDASPLLRQEIRDVTADEIRLKNGNIVTTLASDYRSLRGRTLLLAILDEAPFLRSEDTGSTLPDIECARALLPGLATTGGMLCILSSPYRKQGLLYERHRRFFGKNDNTSLVVQGASTQFNPTLDTSVIKDAEEVDAVASRSEWGGLFRADIASYLDDATLEAAIEHGRPLELPPRAHFKYTAFCDASGGRSDAYTISISHREGERVIVDVVRGQHAPFDPQAITQEFAALAKEYSCAKVSGDNFSGDWVTCAWRDAGLPYERSEKNKSQLYLEALPLFTRGLISIPNHTQLLRELRLLERRTHRSGRDTVDHGPSGHDDHANSVCGCAVLASAATRYRYPQPGDTRWISGPPDPEAAAQAHLAARLSAHIWRGAFRRGF